MGVETAVTESRGRLRVFWLMAGAGLLAAVLVLRLAYWQVVEHKQIAALAADQHQVTFKLPANRGRILDRNGQLLATDTPVFNVVAAPNLIPAQTRAAIAQSLAPLLGMDQGEIVAQISQPLKFTYIKRKVPKATGDKIDSMHLTGIGLEADSQRSYLASVDAPPTTPGPIVLVSPFPQLSPSPSPSPGAPAPAPILPHSLASNLLGFVNNDGAGQYGIEQYYNQQLSGTDGFESSLKTGANQTIVLSDQQRQEPKNGVDLQLAIDSQVQFFAEKALADGVQKTGAESGSVIIMEPSTGNIVAWADYPSFDANSFGGTDSKLFTDPVVSGLYEPGSVMKLVTMSGGIDSNSVTPGTSFNETGAVNVGGFTIHDWDNKAHGNITMTKVIEQSLNVGAVKVQQTEGADNFLTYLNRFGIGKATGVDVANEVNQQLPAKTSWHASELATASFGQGIVVTPIEMIDAVNTIASGGRLVKPRAVTATIDGKRPAHRPRPRPRHPGGHPADRGPDAGHDDRRRRPRLRLDRRDARLEGPGRGQDRYRQHPREREVHRQGGGQLRRLHARREPALHDAGGDAQAAGRRLPAGGHLRGRPGVEADRPDDPRAMAHHALGSSAMSFRLSDLVEATGGRLVGGGADLELERLVTDSRQAGPGALFVALAGETDDGHRFLPAAVAAGASALLAEKALERVDTPLVLVPDSKEALVAFTRHRLAAQPMKVVGITGSAGKTSTKEMIAAVLARRYQVLKTEGNLNTYTGLPTTVAGLEPRHQVFVAEYAMSAPGEIALLARMAPPDYAVVLNVGLAHAGMPGLGSLEAVAAAKRELVEALDANGTAVLNADDPLVRAMADTPGRAIFFSRTYQPEDASGSPWVRAENVRSLGLGGSEFDLVLAGERVPARVQVPGDHAISNALAAAATGFALDVPAADIADTLAGFAPVAGRMVLRPGRRGSTVIDDTYNASPAAVEAALAVLLAETGRPRLAVLGDMLELGDAAPEAHRRIGAAAAGADLLVTVGELAGEIREGAIEAGMPADRVAEAAVDAVAALLEPRLEGALVLVKASRGVALEKVVAALVDPT